jgi:alanine racemase
MVQLDNLPDAEVGDEVVFIGRQEAEEITPEELGSAWGSNNYEVVCGLAGRLPRLYIR